MTYTCIVPAYNEAPRISGVLSAILEAKSVSRTICIDDGSTDGTYDAVRHAFPEVKLIRNAVSLGKIRAISQALQSVRTDTVILIDGDLVGLKGRDIENAIGIYQRNSLDCLLLCAKAVNILDSLARIFLRLPHIATGNRIIDTRTLAEAIGSSPDSGYALEVVQNRYLMKHGMRTGYTDISARNVFKSQKIGLLRGFASEYRMWSQIFRVAGAGELFRQVMYFARDRYVR